MARRKTVLATNQLYHVFNRGVNRNPIFSSPKDYERLLLTLRYYRTQSVPVKLSRYLTMSIEERERFDLHIYNTNASQNKLVEIVAYCLMPNHFHLLLRQVADSGISDYLRLVTNSYTRYFNTRHERTGTLVQGAFKAVHVETDDQLMHLSRYIHLNPVAGTVIKLNDVSDFPWSSLHEYLHVKDNSLSNPKSVLELFDGKSAYEKFVLDFADFQQNVIVTKQLAID